MRCLDRYPPAVIDPIRRALSRSVGCLADLPLPRPLRPPLMRAFGRLTGAQMEEAGLPLDQFGSLGEFFARPLKEGCRPIDLDPDALVSPVDGRVQRICTLRDGMILQAKGFEYPCRELLAGVGEGVNLEGGVAMTLYLSPSDYHRIHTPAAGTISEARWVRGHMHSVAPSVLTRKMVLPINERCVLRLDTERGPLLMVLVAALNVARLILNDVPTDWSGAVTSAVSLERGSELGRFELGSTVIVIAPPKTLNPDPSLTPDAVVRVGRRIASWV